MSAGIGTSSVPTLAFLDFEAQAVLFDEVASKKVVAAPVTQFTIEAAIDVSSISVNCAEEPTLKAVKAQVTVPELRHPPALRIARSRKRKRLFQV